MGAESSQFPLQLFLPRLQKLNRRRRIIQSTDTERHVREIRGHEHIRDRYNAALRRALAENGREEIADGGGEEKGAITHGFIGWLVDWLLVIDN